MGGGKAVVDFRGRPLWSYGYDLLSSFCHKVVLVGECPEIALPKLVEAEPGQGPLGGMVAALRASQTDWNFVLAVDYPLLDRAFVTELGEPRAGDARLPVCQGQRHPLSGYYHRRAGVLLPTGGSVLRALEAVAVEWVEFSSTERFLNVNRPEDLRETEQRLGP